ncbi:hypothetical protein BDR22DRAFT_260604 [Usnea florida]
MMSLANANSPRKENPHAPRNPFKYITGDYYKFCIPTLLRSDGSYSTINTRNNQGQAAKPGGKVLQPHDRIPLGWASTWAAETFSFNAMPFPLTSLSLSCLPLSQVNPPDTDGNFCRQAERNLQVLLVQMGRLSINHETSETECDLAVQKPAHYSIRVCQCLLSLSQNERVLSFRLYKQKKLGSYLAMSTLGLILFFFVSSRRSS